MSNHESIAPEPAGGMPEEPRYTYWHALSKQPGNRIEVVPKSDYRILRAHDLALQERVRGLKAELFDKVMEAKKSGYDDGVAFSEGRLREAEILLDECRDYLVTNDHEPEIYIYNPECKGCQLQDRIKAALAGRGEKE